jgi:hypothetical protein
MQFIFLGLHPGVCVCVCVYSMPSTLFIVIVIFGLHVSPLLAHLQVRDLNAKRSDSSTHILFLQFN